MSLDLPPLAAMGDWFPPCEHLDPEDDLLPVPADEQPVRWDDDEYRDEVA